MNHFPGKERPPVISKESGKTAAFRESGGMVWGMWGFVDHYRWPNTGHKTKSQDKNNVISNVSMLDLATKIQKIQLYLNIIYYAICSVV